MDTLVPFTHSAKGPWNKSFNFWFWYEILVGGWTNPIEKYDRQIGSFPQVGVKIENTWTRHL